MATSAPSTRSEPYTWLLHQLPAIERADAAADELGHIASRLTDPREVATSGVLPDAVWRAYEHAGSVLFGPELEQALQLSLGNIPALGGRTLVLVDVSGSMQAPVAGHDGIRAYEIGAVFAAAIAHAARRGGGGADVVVFANGSERIEVHPSVPRTVRAVGQRIGQLGHASRTWPNARRWYARHDRVCVFTDRPDDPAAASAINRWRCPVYVWDLRGDGPARLDPDRHRFLFAGAGAATFRLLPVLEAGQAPIPAASPPIAA